MWRYSMSFAISLGVCLMTGTAWAQVRGATAPAAVAPVTPAPTQTYPSGTYHGYFQTPYPNDALPRTAYDSPGTSGTQTGLGQANYVPPYAPEYDYSDMIRPQAPGGGGGGVTAFPGDTGRIGLSLMGRLPDQVPEVQPEPSGYSPTDNRAHVRVQVPANAVVWFNGTRTELTGSSREFNSPNLTPGKEYTYTVRASWDQNGRQVSQTQNIDVSAGSEIDLTFPRSTNGSGR
jgi:uncharacterized protein (TIGR03000 family)